MAIHIFSLNDKLRSVKNYLGVTSKNDINLYAYINISV